MRILAVDDNPVTGILLTETLNELGHEVVVLDDPGQTLAAFQRERPDACILDWMMPGADGLELACELRKLGGSDLYIIMLSAKQDLEAIGLAYELGVDDFVTKPVAIGEIRARLRVAERLHSLRSECADRKRELAAMAAELAKVRSAA